MTESELVEELARGIHEAQKDTMRAILADGKMHSDIAGAQNLAAARYVLSVLGWKDAKKEPPKEEGKYAVLVAGEAAGTPKGTEDIETTWYEGGHWAGGYMDSTVAYYRLNIPLPEDK